MPIKGTSKEKRQYQNFKASAKNRGHSTRRSKEIAAATVNKQRPKSRRTGGPGKKSGGRKKSTQGKS